MLSFRNLTELSKKTKGVIEKWPVLVEMYRLTRACESSQPFHVMKAWLSYLRICIVGEWNERKSLKEGIGSLGTWVGG
jgi:hypothetical protein